MRRTTATFPSDDEWEEIDRIARTRYWVHVQSVRLALFLAGALVLFGLVSFFASHSSPRRCDAWGLACELYIRERNGNGD